MEALTFGGSALENFFEFLYVVILFVIVLFFAWIVTRWIGKMQKNRYGATGNFELLEAFRISGNKYIQIIRVGKKYFVIAVCKDTVTFIGELSEEDLTLVNREVSDKKFVSFGDILERIRNTENKNKFNGSKNE